MDFTQESSVIVTGKIQAEARAPGGYEMHVSAIEVVQRVPESDPYPIQLKEHGVDFLLDHRHLWIRTPRQAAILRIRAEALRAARNYMDARATPSPTRRFSRPPHAKAPPRYSRCNYIDDEKAYLTQSGQLYVEATAAALGKVYTFGPTFRAEKSKTRRHLTEFWMLEPEAAYAHLEDMMALGEGLVSHVVQVACRKIARGNSKRSAAMSPNWKIVRPPFPRLTYDEAIEVLQKARKSREVGRRFRRRRGNHSLERSSIARSMIHRYPAAIKAFYMEPIPYALNWRWVSTCSPRKATAKSSAAANASSYDLLVKRAPRK